MGVEASEQAASVQRLKRALVALEKMQSRISELERAGAEPIAIVGIGARMPGGSDSPAAFWELLAAGIDATSDVPPDRWDVDFFYDPDPGVPGKMYTRRGAFVGHLREFDAPFFRISPREANSLDPQQRLALEVGWEALENAGVAPDSLAGSLTGIFLGIASTEYFQHLDRSHHDENDIYVGTGNTHSAAAGRISFILGLQGPCIAVDTACSSSLVSVHLACQSLRSRECDLALAGGVNRLVVPQVSVHFSKVRALSRDGRCKTFDASADGYGRGEGCGFVVLRRLSDAVAHRDHIHALIAGSAVNHDGASSGLTVPSAQAQQAVIRAALERARIRPDQVSYVEAHGTGTPLGDPIEVRALQAVFGKGRSAEAPLVVGSVKTNIGHLEPAAGIAGLIKTMLALEHGEIPAHLHVQELNPHVSWTDCPLVVPRQKMPWPGATGDRFAGVSAFGFSGTNAHVIVQGYDTPASSPPTVERPLHVLALSARTQNALGELVHRYRAHLESVPDDRVADVCFTANAGRSHFQHRLAVVVDSRRSALEQLRKIENGEDPRGALRGDGGTAPRVAFLFTGQGSQHLGMGRALYDSQPAFRRTLDECDAILEKELHQRIVPILYGSDADAAALDETGYTQPILFSLEYALAQLWRSWGVEPAAVIGHSIGEYVAACVAGVFSLPDALRLVAARGRLMGSLPAGGGMFAVLADESTVGAAIEEYAGQVSIAAVNGALNTVISGTNEALGRAAAALKRRGITSRRLNVSHAFHSPCMDPILSGFRAAAGEIRYATPRIALVSNVFGRVVSDEVTTPEYWVRQLREPVRFGQGVGALAQQKIDAFLEIGPATTLLSMSRQGVPDQGIAFLATLNGGKADWQTILTSLAALYARGASIDWEAFDNDYRRHRVELPTYPFQRQTFWIDAAPAGQPRPSRPPAASSDGPACHPLLGRRVHLARSSGAGLFESALSQDSPEFLRDHRVHKAVVAPAAGFIEMALAAASNASGHDAWNVTNMSFPKALVLGGDEVTVQCWLANEGDGRLSFEISSARTDADQQEPTWVRHVTGGLTRGPALPDWADAELASVQARREDEVPPDVFYAKCRERGIEYGPSFRALRGAWHVPGGALGHVELSAEVGSHTSAYRFHPALLDACLQPLGLLPELAAATGAWIPLGLERLVVLRQPGAEAWSYVRSRPPSNGSGSSDVHVDALVYAPGGELLAVLENLHVGRLSKAALAEEREDSFQDWFYDIRWQPQDLQRSVEDVLVPPGANEIADLLRAELPGILERRPVLETYLQGFTALEEVAFRFVLDAFADLGVPLVEGESFTTAELSARSRIAPKQQRLFARLLQVLAERNRLRRDGDRWMVTAPLTRGDAGSALRDTLSRYGSVEAEAALLGRCGPRLADVLTGTTDPLQLIFPGGDPSAATHLYRDSPGSELMNHLLARTVVSILEARDGLRGLRMLEIGGGTGATTSCLVPHLAHGRTEYWFTDISPLFVARMKPQSADLPFLHTAVLDIERDPLSQGFAPHSFDLIVAAQVLHATRDLRQTLNHVKTLLSPDGVLVLLEPTAVCLSTELVAGLLEGWWRFADHHLRPSSPLLSAPEWQALLSDCGFQQATTIAPAESTRTSVDAAVVIAQLEPAPVRESRTWIVLADSGDTGRRLAGELRRRGDRCSIVSQGDTFRRISAYDYEVDVRNANDLSALFRRIAPADGTDAPGVVYLWGLDACRASDPSAGDTPDASRGACVAALHVVQSLLRVNPNRPARLWIVTRGAVPVGAATNPPALAGSALWGLGKVVALEHPELQCVLLDLDLDESGSPIPSVVNELRDGQAGEQVAIRGGKRFVARLARSAPSSLPAPPSPASLTHGYSLAIASRGTPDNLRFVRAVPRPPGRQEVQVRVKATGLNFADVMDALGLLPFDRPSFGVEFAGEISGVGDGVEGFTVGDRVFGAAAGSFDSHVTLACGKLRKIPDNLSFEDAATITVAFATAYYALHHVAGMKPGDKVLVHAAAGGVGLAAVQLAQLAGAEVFGTAHPDKWERLKALGVRHVMSSRTPACAEQILSATGGTGVDIVLNSLTGEMIPASLAVLRPGGTFVEIGKRDIWTPDRMAREKPGIQYSVVDLLGMLAGGDQGALDPVLDSLLTLFANGQLRPLPRTVFPLDGLVPAFRYMQQAKHFGKVVLAHRSDAGEDTRTAAFRQDATYLIVGGMGGLGLVAAEWLVTRGARHIVLMGRHAPAGGSADAIRRLEGLGAQIAVLCGDVAKEDDVRAVLGRIEGSLPPLRGIIHSALALDDAIVINQDAGRFDRVFAPKVDGAWLLHTHTIGLDLDFFILFSAGASLLGNPGQANYAAANAFLDSLAHDRRARGLAAMSINWGPWSVGAAAARGLDERMRLMGLSAIDPEQGLEILDALYAWNPVQIGVLPIRWREAAGRFAEWPLVSDFRTESAVPAGDQALLSRLDGASPDEKRSLVAHHVRAQIAGVLGLEDEDDIPLQKGFFDLGMDSLTAVELRNKLQATFGCTLPPTLAFDYPTVGGLIDFIARDVLAGPEPEIETPDQELPDADVSALLGHVEGISDADALALLKNPAGGLRQELQ